MVATFGSQSSSLYNPQMTPQQAMIQRRLMLAQKLSDEGQQDDSTQMVGNLAVPQSPLSAASKALSTALSGYEEGKAYKDMKDQAQSRQQALAAALDTGMGKPAGKDPSTGITWNQARPGDQNAMIAQLMQSPETADVGMQMQMGRMQSQQDLQDAIAKEKAIMPLEIEKARQTHAIDSQITPYQQAELDLKRKDAALPFQGTGMDAQTMNILLQGDPTSPQYKAAYAFQAQPKITVDPQTGAQTIVHPDMSAFRQPGVQARPTPTNLAPQNPGMTLPIPGQQAAPPPELPPPAESALPPDTTAPRQPGLGGVDPAYAKQTAPQIAAPPAPPAQPKVEYIPGTRQNFNENQALAAGFADRMATSGDIIDNIGNVGTDAVQAGKAAVPLLGNFIVSPDKQRLEQAERDFINAQLRRESGASISPSEFENARKQYFPQPGDSPEVLAQKQQNREIARSAMQRTAGPSYKAPGIPTFSDPNDPAFAALPPGSKFQIVGADGKPETRIKH